MKISELIAELISFYRKTPPHKHVLGSMTTIPDPLSIYAYQLFIRTNLADPYTFKIVGEIEDILVKEISKDLYGKSSTGKVVSGGTESNIIAVYSGIKKYRSRTVLAPDTVHVSVDKACEFLNCKLVKIPTGNNPVEPSIVEDYIRKYKPSTLVITAGTTELGIIDPVKELSSIAREYSVWLHVDAAYGGLLIPFLYKHGRISEDLKLYDGINSLSIDFHKYGLSPIPSGLYIVGNPRDLDLAYFESKYMPTGKTFGILGTRPGGSVLAIWAVWKKYGYKGYEKIALEKTDLARYLADRLRRTDKYIVWGPSLTIVNIRHISIAVNELVEALARRGFYLYFSPSINAARIAIMPHHRREHIDEFANILEEIE